MYNDNMRNSEITNSIIDEPMWFGIAYPRGRTAFTSRTVPNHVGFLMR